MAVVWSMLMVASVLVFRTRGFWLLIGGPIAFFWPVWPLPVWPLPDWLHDTPCTMTGCLQR